MSNNTTTAGSGEIINPYNGDGLAILPAMWPAIIVVGLYYIVFLGLFIWRRKVVCASFFYILV